MVLLPEAKCRWLTYKFYQRKLEFFEKNPCRTPQSCPSSLCHVRVLKTLCHGLSHKKWWDFNDPSTLCSIRLKYIICNMLWMQINGKKPRPFHWFTNPHMIKWFIFHYRVIINHLFSWLLWTKKINCMFQVSSKYESGSVGTNFFFF